MNSTDREILFTINWRLIFFKKNLVNIDNPKNIANIKVYKKNTLISIDLILLKKIKNRIKGSSSAR